MEFSLLDFGEWAVDQLRVTLFHHPSNPSPPDTLWRTLVGHPPESIDSRPQMGLTTVSGADGKNNLALTLQKGRVDWLLLPQPENPDMPFRVQTLKLSESTSGLLQSAADQTAAATGPILRLALGASLIKPTADEAAAIEETCEFLNLPGFDVPQSGDFIFQVNRRRQTIHGAINRVAKWSVVQVGQMTLQMELQAVPDPKVQHSEIIYARRLELDINTIPGGAAIRRERARTLLSDLLEMAKEIAVKGDIR